MQISNFIQRLLEKPPNPSASETALFTNRFDPTFQLVLDTIPAGVFWKDRDGVFRGCNQRFASDLGVPKPEDVVGKDDYAFVLNRKQADAYKTMDEEVMANGRARHKIRECMEAVDGGHKRWLETSKVPLHDQSGEVVGLLGTYEDITDWLDAEERLSQANVKLERAALLKDQFLAGMSHELRTPLNAILGISESLMEDVYGELTDKQRSALTLVEEGGKHLLALINDILDISRLEAGELTLELNEFPVDELCEMAIQLITEQARAKELTLTLDVEERESIGTVMADQRRMKQVLLNLLSNAVKFTEEGGEIALRVRANGHRHTIQFIVEDNGIGIAPDKADELFKPFRQIDNTLSRSHNGSGLGLAIVKHMVELHGGKIEVASELGLGNPFTVTIPRK